MWFWKCCFRSRLPCCTTASQSVNLFNLGPATVTSPFSLDTHFHWHSFLCKAEGCCGTMGRVCQPVYREPRSVVLLLKTTCQKLWSHVPVSVVQATLTFFTCHLLFNVPKLCFAIIFQTLSKLFSCVNMLPKLFPKIIFIIGTETGLANL